MVRTRTLGHFMQPAGMDHTIRQQPSTGRCMSLRYQGSGILWISWATFQPITRCDLGNLPRPKARQRPPWLQASMGVLPDKVRPDRQIMEGRTTPAFRSQMRRADQLGLNPSGVFQLQLNSMASQSTKLYPTRPLFKSPPPHPPTGTRTVGMARIRHTIGLDGLSTVSETETQFHRRRRQRSRRQRQRITRW